MSGTFNFENLLDLDPNNFLSTQQDFLTPGTIIPGVTIIVAGIITASAIALALGLTNKRYRRRETPKIIFKVDDSEPTRNEGTEELP